MIEGMRLGQHKPGQGRGERCKEGKRQDLKLAAAVAVEPVEPFVEQYQQRIAAQQRKDEADS
jgi:hypothetical protein